MKRQLIRTRARVLWLAALLVFSHVAVAESSGSSVFPVRLSDPSTPDTAASTPGDQGEIVDALVLTVESDSACTTDLIRASVLYEWCADDDGCTLRLIARIGTFASLVPHLPATLVARSTEGRWVVRVAEPTGVVTRQGIMGDFNQQKLLEFRLDSGTGLYDACLFFDDHSEEPGGTIVIRGFGLKACESNGVRAACSLRVDD